MTMSIANFHCDLLSYLEEGENRTPYDPESRTSIPQLRQGGVVLETLAIYTKTKKGSATKGEKQFEIFKTLPQEDIRFVLAIENASGICEEDEPFEKGIERLERFLKEAGFIAYIGLTWNEENRFGGGNSSKVGLKPDGKKLLEWMRGKKIAIDFSHTSDALAYDILKLNLDITPIASHSNFRKISDYPRNLPDDIAQEIVRRGGLIGLNFFRPFLGPNSIDDFLRQLEHAEKIGVLERFCFGADFFDDSLISSLLSYSKPYFHPGFDTSACYPKIIEMLKREFKKETIEKIAYKNIQQFLTI